MSTNVFNGVTARPWHLIAWPSRATARVIVDELSHLGPSSRVADIGVGTGIVASRLVDKLGVHVDGVDPSLAMLDIASGPKDHVSLYSGTAEEIPLPSSSYDAVVSVAVLKFIDYHKAPQVLKETSRILKLNGRFIVADLNLPRLRPDCQSVESSLDSKVLGVWSRYSRKEFIELARTEHLVYVRTRYPFMSFMMVFVRQ